MVVVALGIAAVAHLSRSNLLSCLLPNPDRTGNGVPLIIASQLLYHTTQLLQPISDTMVRHLYSKRPMS